MKREDFINRVKLMGFKCYCDYSIYIYDYEGKRLIAEIGDEKQFEINTKNTCFSLLLSQKKKEDLYNLCDEYVRTKFKDRGLDSE